MTWVALEVERHHEGHVFDELWRQDIEAFLPRAMARKGTASGFRIQRPLILPGYVFARHGSPVLILEAFHGPLSHISGFLRDESGRPHLISDSEMAAFVSAYHDWIMAQERAWQSGQRPRRKKFSRRFSFTPCDLARVGQEIFGLAEAYRDGYRPTDWPAPD